MALCVIDLCILKFSRLLLKSKAEILPRSAEKKKKNGICFFYYRIMFFVINRMSLFWKISYEMKYKWKYYITSEWKMMLHLIKAVLRFAVCCESCFTSFSVKCVTQVHGSGLLFSTSEGVLIAVARGLVCKRVQSVIAELIKPCNICLLCNSPSTKHPLFNMYRQYKHFFLFYA